MLNTDSLSCPVSERMGARGMTPYEKPGARWRCSMEESPAGAWLLQCLLDLVTDKRLGTIHAIGK